LDNFLSGGLCLFDAFPEVSQHLEFVFWRDAGEDLAEQDERLVDHSHAERNRPGSELVFLKLVEFTI